MSLQSFSDDVLKATNETGFGVLPELLATSTIRRISAGSSRAKRSSSTSLTGYFPTDQLMIAALITCRKLGAVARIVSWVISLRPGVHYETSPAFLKRA